MRAKSKQPISKIQRQLWEECRRIKNKPSVDCYTCGAKDLQGSNKQLGHLWSKATLSAYLKYDLRVLEWQCMRCNVHGGGMGADYYKRKLAELGEKEMARLEQDRQKTVKAYDFYLELLDKYRAVENPLDKNDITANI